MALLFFSFNLAGEFINSINHAPVANAGVDLLSAGDITLNGNSSVDADNDQIVYKWEQIAGPSTVTLINANTSTTQATGFKSGEYYFKLTVDDGKDVDFDIVKVICETNTKLKEVSDKGIVIFPNPVHDSFSISSIEDQHVDSVQVFDMNGRLIKVVNVNSNIVSLSGISAGYYCIRLLSKGRLCKVVQILKN